MAKKRKGKKGRKKGRRYGRKSRGSTKMSAAVAGGALGTAYLIAMHGDALPYVIKNPNFAGLKAGVTAAKNGALTTGVWLPLVAGVGIHWGKSKPVLNIVGRPLNQLSKKVLHRPL